jgi:hypothetical protein
VLGSMWLRLRGRGRALDHLWARPARPPTDSVCMMRWRWRRSTSAHPRRSVQQSRRSAKHASPTATRTGDSTPRGTMMLTAILTARRCRTPGGGLPSTSPTSTSDWHARPSANTPARPVRPHEPSLTLCATAAAPAPGKPAPSHDSVARWVARHCAGR